MIPTVGFNMRKITKGRVTIKLWDIGGQPRYDFALEQLETLFDAFNRRFRSMWERYCRGVNAIVYMVDSADSQKIEVFDILKHRNYLKSIEKKQLDRLPISHQTKTSLPRQAGQNWKTFWRDLNLREFLFWWVKVKNKPAFRFQSNLTVSHPL